MYWPSTRTYIYIGKSSAFSTSGMNIQSKLYRDSELLVFPWVFFEGSAQHMIADNSPYRWVNLLEAVLSTVIPFLSSCISFNKCLHFGASKGFFLAELNLQARRSFVDFTWYWRLSRQLEVHPLCKRCLSKQWMGLFWQPRCKPDISWYCHHFLWSTNSFPASNYLEMSIFWSFFHTPVAQLAAVQALGCWRIPLEWRVENDWNNSYLFQQLIIIVRTYECVGADIKNCHLFDHWYQCRVSKA